MKEKLTFVRKLIGMISYIGGYFWRIIKWYKDLWVRVTHNKYDEFVYKRGAAMLVATFLAVIIVPMVISFFAQTAFYFTTSKKEEVYLSASQEIDNSNNVWVVRGCRQTICDSNESLYYRIKPSMFHHVWNLLDSGHFFLSDALGASIPLRPTKCEVTSYGIRKRMTMMFNIYPIILKVSCKNGQENVEPVSTKS